MSPTSERIARLLRQKGKTTVVQRMLEHRRGLYILLMRTEILRLEEQSQKSKK